MKRIARIVPLLVAALLATASLVRAEDSDILRYYLHLKFRDTDNRTGVHDYYGFSLGANLNKYFGVELSADRFEIFPEIREVGTIGEYGVFALMPQLRVRYPLLGDKLVPYVIGGGGIGLTGFNDRKSPGFGVPINWESTTPVATVGAGVEYFFADNLAFTAEFKYLFAGHQTLDFGGGKHDINPSAPLASVGLRMFYPELRPPSDEAFRDPAPLRLFFLGRIGLAEPTQKDLGSGLEVKPVPPAIGGELAQYFGLGFGMDIGKYLGFEFGVEGYEVNLALKGLGSVTEYAFYGAIPRLRVRYPLGNGRWVPYAMAGVGVGYAEANDRKPAGADLMIDSKTFSVAASAGAGIEYFITSNIAFGAETKYLYSPGHHVTISPGPSTDVTLQAFVASIGVRMYFWDFRF